MDPVDRDAILAEIEALRADIDAKDEEAERLLLERMEHEDAEVRVAAVEAVWEYYYLPRVLDRALVLVRSDPDPRVARAALVALGRVIQEGIIDDIEDTPIEALSAELDIDPKVYWKVREFLLAAAQDEGTPVDVRRFALESLGYAGTRADVAALLFEWYAMADPSARRSAVFAMGLSGCAEYARQILRHVEDEDIEMRLVAIRAAGLGRIGDARDAVLAASRHKDARVRLAAAEALGGYGGEKVLDRLEEMQDDADEGVRDAARESMETAWDVDEGSE
ncbi:MAG: HEAT repeat domain-containing protein [Planctomycetota bacterium]